MADIISSVVVRQESNRLHSTRSRLQVHSSRRPGHPYGAYRQGWHLGGTQQALQEGRDKDQAVRAARGGLIATTVGVDLASVAGRAGGGWWMCLHRDPGGGGAWCLCVKRGARRLVPFGG